MKINRGAALAVALVAIAGLAGCKEDPVEAHRLKGHELYKKEQWAQAAEEYRLSLQANPQQEKLWEKLAAAYMRAGDSQKAVEALLKTVDFKPDPQAKAEVYRNVAGMLIQGPKPFEAEQYFIAAVKLEPKDDGSLLWLAEMESTRGGARNMEAAPVQEHLDKAISYYDQTIAAKPEALLAYVNKRIVLLKLMNEAKKEKGSAEAVAAALRKEPERRKEALDRAAEQQARIDELKAKVDELSDKITELQKKGIKLK
jgi:tetratricopeptide (TPR) repeat protein